MSNINGILTGLSKNGNTTAAGQRQGRTLCARALYAFHVAIVPDGLNERVGWYIICYRQCS